MPTMSLGETLGEQPAAKTAMAIRSVKRARTLGLADFDSAEIIIVTRGRECRHSGVRRSVTISRRTTEPRAGRHRRGHSLPNPHARFGDVPLEFAGVLADQE